MLVEKNQGLPEATKAAVKGIANDNEHINQSALKLFKQLIIKAPNETKRVIQEILSNTSSIRLKPPVRRELRKLLT